MINLSKQTTESNPPPKYLASAGTLGRFGSGNLSSPSAGSKPRFSLAIDPERPNCLVGLCIKVPQPLTLPDLNPQHPKPRSEPKSHKSEPKKQHTHKKKSLIRIQKPTENPTGSSERVEREGQGLRVDASLLRSRRRERERVKERERIKKGRIRWVEKGGATEASERERERLSGD